MASSAAACRYENMLANSATAAVCASADNVILSWNSSAEEILGYSAKEAIGRPLSIIIPERLRASHDAGLKRAVGSGTARLAGKAVEILALHADGHELPIELSLSMWLEDGIPFFGGLIRDISDRQAAQRRLEHLAHCDTLTSLPNRNALQAKLIERIDQSPCSLLLLDLDGFKLVNDTLGHNTGDQLLVEVATRLTCAIEKNDQFVARLGGDEFAIILSGNLDIIQLDAICSTIFGSLRKPFYIDDQNIYIGTSIGIAMSPDHGATVEQLLSAADLALYSAKGKGGGKREFFAPSMQSRSEHRHRLGTELRLALERDELELWFQPQVSLTTGELRGAEALLRWRHPKHGILNPGAFISVLEESAIAEAVGARIIEQACLAGAQWTKSGYGSIKVAVNLFSAQLRSESLLDVISSALARTGLPPQQLELEITENTALKDNDHSLKILRKLRSAGVNIAFDDFGTGFAALSLLQKYPLSGIKIDMSFVSRIAHHVGDAAIVRSVVEMSQALGLRVTAEGVETEEQERILVALGCDEAQGFRYGQPAVLEHFNSTYLHEGMRTRIRAF